MKKLIIIGAGGAGHEVLFVARRMGGWEIVAFADDALHLIGTNIDGIPVFGSIEKVAESHYQPGVFFHCSIGNNSVRQKKVEHFESKGFLPATLIDPSAIVADHASIGAGSYIGAYVFVGPHAEVKRHVIANVGASIGHHTVTENYAQVCPGARLTGFGRLGEGALIGSNAVVVPGISVGDWAVLGAVSFASRDIPARVSAIGVPARVVAPAPH